MCIYEGTAPDSVVKELTFSCPIGSAHSQSIPLKNGGTFSMRLRGDIVGSSDKRYFTVHPQTVNLLPDEVRKKERERESIDTLY